RGAHGRPAPPAATPAADAVRRRPFDGESSLARSWGPAAHPSTIARKATDGRIVAVGSAEPTPAGGEGSRNGRPAPPSPPGLAEYSPASRPQACRRAARRLRRYSIRPRA